MKNEEKNSSNDLMVAIKKRSAEREQQMDNFFARMEAKYCTPKRNKKNVKKT